MILEFFVDCHPPSATAQHKSVRVVRARETGRPTPIFFEAGAVKAARETLTRLLRRPAPPAPLAGPLKLTATWTFYWTKADEKRRRRGRLPAWVPKVTRSDTDNLVKMLKDVMTERGYWADDAHVSAEYLRRGYGDRPGIHIRVEPYVADYEPPEGDPVAEVVL